MVGKQKTGIHLALNVQVWSFTDGISVFIFGLFNDASSYCGII
jgi:hypothetical protein